MALWETNLSYPIRIMKHSIYVSSKSFVLLFLPVFCRKVWGVGCVVPRIESMWMLTPFVFNGLSINTSVRKGRSKTFHLQESRLISDGVHQQVFPEEETNNRLFFIFDILSCILPEFERRSFYSIHFRNICEGF